MPLSVIVRRGAGSHPGEDIVDPLITILPVALARGRNELDERGSGLQDVQVSVPYRTGIRLGQVVRVRETLFGTTWYGKVSGISHRCELASDETTLTIKKPTEFKA